MPSAPADGVIVDLTYAERAAAGNVAPATAQVWVRGPVNQVRKGLTGAGVVIIDQQSSSALDDEFSRQGPSLPPSLQC